MDRDAVVRTLALCSIPLIAGGLYLARERRPATTPAPSVTPPPAEPRGLGPLAGDLAERGEAALAAPKPSAVPAAPPADAVAATNLPLASNQKPAAKRARASAPRGSCSGVEVRLITESEDPSWAFASLSPAAGERAVIRRVGERIGDYRVAKIEWDRVWLSGSGGRCAASMHFGAREAGEKSGKGEAPWRLSGELVDGIEKLGETRFAVDRGLLPTLYAQAGQLLAGVQIEPVRRDTEVVGFELGEVRVDSLLERLGIESGDRVLAIDTAPVKDLESLLKALTAAREKERLVARLERQGEAFDLEVSAR